MSSESAFSDRRLFLSLLGSVAATTALTGCETLPIASNILSSNRVHRGTIIDVHCHIFNGSDLPASRFLKIVFSKQYRREAALELLDVDDPDIVDVLIQIFLWVLGKSRAPSADAEANLLAREPARRSVAESRKSSEASVAKAVASYYAQNLDGAPEVGGEQAAQSKVKRAILFAGGERDKAPSLGPITEAQTESAARQAMASDFDIGRYLRWFALFTRYRASLADQLVANHKADGFDSVLICPALIDYDAWLGERVRKSPLRSQIYVMGAISARPRGPAVHGYVAFDPLRQVNFDRNVDRRENPLNLVRQALKEYGFLGVKLYPPMGFRASGNQEKPAQRYPEPVDAALDGRVGEDLNIALDKLYALCIELDAPVIAHAGPSNGAGPTYASRADPAYWIPVFEKYPKLHVCLAHFGGFSEQSIGFPVGTPLPRGSWDWAFGDFIRRHPDSPVFADLSYFAEISRKSQSELSDYAQLLRTFFDECDPDCRHLMFGSDWIMLGMDSAAKDYASNVYEFFKNQCEFSDDKLNRLFYGNAARFLGLRPNDPTRRRLMNFYRENGLSQSRLPDFADT